jgi:hypothetical protein
MPLTCGTPPTALKLPAKYSRPYPTASVFTLREVAGVYGLSGGGRHERSRPLAALSATSWPLVAPPKRLNIPPT